MSNPRQKDKVRLEAIIFNVGGLSLSAAENEQSGISFSRLT